MAYSGCEIGTYNISSEADRSVYSGHALFVPKPIHPE